jgi:hypothetical protein
MHWPDLGLKTVKRWPSDPYKGLTYYEEGDLPLFAGRDSDIDAVCGSIGLGNIRILLLHGMTGCGKSSFLRAGLIPALEEEISGYEFLRDENSRPDFVRATDDPTASLARRVHRFIKREYSSPKSKRRHPRYREGASEALGYQPKETLNSAISRREMPSLVADAALNEAEFLRAVAINPQRLVRTVEQIASQRPRTFVLVIDQAEEVVTLKPESTGDPARIQFFDFLSDISRSRYDLKVIVCFRTEYHGQFYAQLRYGADVSRINDYYLNDFTEGQLLEAILRPTSRDQILGYGAPYEQYHFDYDRGLPNEIAKALLAPGISGGVLPALQIVCRRLYEEAKSKSQEESDPSRGRMTLPVWSAADCAIDNTEVYSNLKPFTITEKAFSSLGGVAGQVISYLHSELESALIEPFVGKVGAFERRSEIHGWRKVLTTLVKTQINGTVTTDIIPEETLRREAVAKGCEIEPGDMFAFLNDERRRILRFVDITKLTTKEVIRCCSLGHDVLAGALKEWSERTELERNTTGVTFRTTRIMSNINGKAYAINAITPMKFWKTPVLRLILFIMETVKPLLTDMKRLSFIPFARWVIIGRKQFPRFSEQQPREKLEYDYLIFFGNFNITWNQCIDSFSAVLSQGLNLIYRWTEKFPGSTPVTQFKQYVTSVQFATDYYYVAYPLATTSDVKAAHRVLAALNDFAERSKMMSAEVFEKAYLQFVLNVQLDLGETSVAPLGANKHDE